MLDPQYPSLINIALLIMTCFVMSEVTSRFEREASLSKADCMNVSNIYTKELFHQSKDFSAYWMVSSHSKVFCDLYQSQALSTDKLRVENSISLMVKFYFCYSLNSETDRRGVL